MMFRHRQQLRRWAALVLLLWLFGFGAGVASACMGSGPLVPDRLAATHADGVLHQQDSNAPFQPAGSGDPAAATAAANCMAFCEKASVSFPLLKSALDDLQGQVLHTAVLTAVHPAPVLPLHRPQPQRQDDVWAPSIAIVYLRLTL